MLGESFCTTNVNGSRKIYTMTQSPDNRSPQPTLGKRAGRIDTAGVVIGFLPWLALAGWWLSGDFMLFASAMLSLPPCGLLAFVMGVISRGLPSLALGATDLLLSMPVMGLFWVVTR